MHAPSLPRPASPLPSSAALIRALALVLVAVVSSAALLVATQPPGSPGGVPGAPTGSPSAPAPNPPSRPPSPSPSDPSPVPSDSPAPGRPSPVPTRPPTPVPTPTPGTVGPSPRPTVPGLPVCAYLDVLTPHRHESDWDRTLLDTIYRLPSTYAPGDLVDASVAGLNRGYLVRSFLVDDLRELALAARAVGAPIEIVSAYRSYARQQATFQHWVKVGGYAQALRTSARAGHSEHQLGTTIDVTSLGGAAPWEYRDWATTPAGSFVARNAWRYGFVISYPRGATDRTCYAYEPWHLRYVGREQAAAIRASGLTPREFLWTLQ